MRRSTACFVLARVCLGSAVGSTALAQAAERQSPVEVTVPEPPTPVIGDGKLILGYELHVTNFGQRPLALETVDVYSGSSSKRPIATLTGSALGAAFQIGAKMRMSAMPAQATADTLRIGVGERAVVFVWLTLDPAKQPPATLRHRLRFLTLDDRRRESVIDSLETPVSSHTPILIATPIRGGDWLAGNGPSDSSTHRRTLVPLNGRVRISQRFATDWVKIGPNGNTWRDNRSRNENFWGFGEPVYAVADGEVVAAVDSISDNTPGQSLPAPTIANISGNHVILELGAGQYALYAHLKRGSIAARAGQHVRRGDLIGHLGNSGQTTAPHLHFQVMNSPSDLAAEGIPFVFDQFQFLGFGRDYEPEKPHPSTPKRREMPVDDAVVHFPAGP